MSVGVGASAPARAAWRGAVLAALVALLVGWPGAGELVPMETHEIFVARTAEEMHARGSFLVPYYAEEPRLKKPPLSYWLVLGIDALGADPGRVRTIEARLPSILGAAALAALTVLLARRLGADSGVATLAGVMVGASSGVLQYAHNARPEMLYAACCTAGLLGFAAATAPDARRPRRAALLGWAAMGLAVLAKGPQLPLMLVVGWLVAERRPDGVRAAWRALHGWIGLVLLLAIGGAWPAAILLVRDDALAVWRGETLSRVVGTTSPWRLLEPYYLYRPLALVAPWVVPYVVALIAPWIPEFRAIFRGRRADVDVAGDEADRAGRPALAPRDGQGSRRMRLAWWLVVAAMLGLSISTGRRWYYMLPVLAPLGILMGEVSVLIGRALVAQGRTGWWAFWVAVHAGGPALGAAWLAYSWNGMPPPAWSVRVPLLVLILGLGLVGTLVAMREARRSRTVRAAIAAGVAASVALATTAATGIAWRGRRHEERDFARIVGAIVPTDEPLFAWREADDEARYHLHRAIPSYPTLERLAKAIPESGGVALLVDAHEAVPAVDREDLAACVIATSMLEGDPAGLQLWWVERAADEPSRGDPDPPGQIAPSGDES